MKQYSIKLTEAHALAQDLASRYASKRLESWHLLLGMVAATDSMASLVLAEFEDRIAYDSYEAEAILTLGRSPKETATGQVQPLASSTGLQQLMADALAISDLVKAPELGTEHVLFAMLVNKDLLPFQILQGVGFVTNKEKSPNLPGIGDIRRALVRQMGIDKELVGKIYQLKQPNRPSKIDPAMMGGMVPQKVGELADYTRDLTLAARQGQLDPVLGRDKEIARVVQVLSRKTKNNPVLVGEAGVGKTALAYGLAHRIVAGQVPHDLKGKRVLELDLTSVVAGTRFRGEFEERMVMIVEEIERAGDVILFMDELHMIMGSGAGVESPMDAANILKPALSRGSLHMMGATTLNEFQKTIDKDPAFSRRFAKIIVDEPSEADSLVILKGLKATYEDYHQVTISDQALETAVKFAKRYLTSKQLPDSAIELLDETSARVRQLTETDLETGLNPLDQALMTGQFKVLAQLLTKAQKTSKASHQVEPEHVLATLSQLSGIPVAKMTKTDRQKYLNLEQELHQRVIGQAEAVSAISRAIRRNQSGIRTGKRPIGSFMFLGPTGVGKTELAKALAELLFDDEAALLRFDMSEYMEKFAASRLNGAPPGYVGYDEGGELTEKVRNKPYAVLLFDEIEKAHPDVFNLFLQILDDGQLTDSKGRKVDFSNTLIIMTSNLGATALRDDKTVGFGAASLSHDHQAMEKRMLEELKKAYRPEFLNRIDEKLVFHNLTPDQVGEIVHIMVKPLTKHLADQGITLKFQKSALKHLAEKGYDKEMGARPLRRVLQTNIEDKLAEMLLADDLQAGQTLKINFAKGKLGFVVQD